GSEGDVFSACNRFGNLVDFVRVCARCYGDTASVEGHMPALDPLRGERPQGGEVGCETSTGSKLGKIARTTHCSNFERETSAVVHAQRSAHRADGERHRKSPPKAVGGSSP